MPQIKVKIVLTAVICDQCDTYFGVPLWLSGSPFHCPLGHLNTAREFETDEPAELDPDAEPVCDECGEAIYQHMHNGGHWYHRESGQPWCYRDLQHTEVAHPRRTPR